MKRYVGLSCVLVLSLAFGLALVASGGEEKTKAMAGPGKYMADYATSKDFFTLMSGMKMGKSPHGSVQIYYSTNIKDMIGMDSFMVPVGTVSIKPFDNDGTPGVDGIAVMIKKEAGYDPANNDWYYEMRDAKGNLKDMPAPGKTKMCIDCHAVYPSKDYLGGTQIR